MVRKEESLLKAISELLDERKGIGFNDLFRELRGRRVLGSRATLAKYLHMLEQHGKIERRIIRDKPPRLVEYRRVEKFSKPSEDLFQKLADDVRTSETIKVTLTDVETGKRRVLVLDKNNNWIPVEDKQD